MSCFGTPAFTKKRIQNEIRQIKTKPIPGFNIELKDESDITKFKGTFKGFECSDYDGGSYEVDFTLPSNYPTKPPTAYFVTKVWHPNISSATGCICMSLLSDKWLLSDNLKTLIVTIQALLVCPQPDDPQDLPVASQFINNPELFAKTAGFWNHYYAGGPKKEYCDEFMKKVEQVSSAGYSKDKTIHALSMKNWDVQEAMAFLSDQ